MARGSDRGERGELMAGIVRSATRGDIVCVVAVEATEIEFEVVLVV